MRRRSFVLGTLVVLACRGRPGLPPEDGGSVVYVVRHAEKVVSAEQPDPALTEAGVARASALPDALPMNRIQAIFTTDTRRTRDTVAPLAARVGLEPRIYDAADHAALVRRIRALPPGAVVVVGHSNTIADLLHALGVQETVTIDDDQYGDLFEVHLQADGAVLRRGHFGTGDGEP